MKRLPSAVRLLPLLAVGLLAIPNPGRAADAAPQLSVAAPFGDGMVLQRERKVAIWGAAPAGVKVQVAFDGQVRTTTAGADGGWRVELDPMKASAEDRTLTITAGDRHLEIKQVLVGEVWLCSGQSNMEMGIKGCIGGVKEVQDDPLLRIRQVNQTLSQQPATGLDGSPWLPCTPQNLADHGQMNGFSGTAYYFAKHLRAELRVPVAVIQSAWGGTRIEAWMPTEKPLEKFAPNNKGQPGVLYNAMIHPWAGYGVRGVLWYQGEANLNQGDGPEYATKMQSMVAGWRKAFGVEKLPFFYVQLAPYEYNKGPERLPEFWEIQSKAEALIPDSGMAVTIDIGHLKNIHPTNKQEVGRRLALLALGRTYGVKTAAACSPSCTDIQMKDQAALLTFRDAGTGLKTRDGQAITGFELAGADQVFHAAQAVIEGTDRIKVTCAEVAAPCHVRFAWRADAVPNLVNGLGLPIGAFRSQPPANPARP